MEAYIQKTTVGISGRKECLEILESIGIMEGKVIGGISSNLIKRFVWMNGRKTRKTDGNGPNAT